MIQLHLTIKKVQMMEQADPYARVFVNGPSVHREYNIHLRISATDDNGNLYWFKTPNIKCDKASGFLSYNSYTIPKTNKWFEIVKGEKGGIKGAEMFNGGDTPNVCIYDKTTVKPTVSVGQQITIIANESGKGTNVTFLNRVKLVIK